MNEAPENVRLIGGEMLLWSDMSAVAGVTEWQGAALELIRRLLPAGGRVLLVGPHPQPLVDEVVANAAAAAVLLRSFPDACALGERHPDLTVFCGRLEALDVEEPYDLVLALDGLLRTHSAEAPASAWKESLAALAGLVAPGGRLALGVRNDLGVDRFLEARPAGREGGDDQWAPHGFDPSYPSGPEALDQGIESAGLTLRRSYAVYPDRQAPRSLLSREALAHDLPDALAFTLSAREDERTLVADPLRLTRLVFRHRLGERLAPMWLAVATRPSQTPEAPEEPEELPLGLVEEKAVLYELTPAGARRLPDGGERPVPAGRVVEEILVEACAREDVKTVREVLTDLAAWLDEGGEVSAATDSLVHDGERFAAIGPPTGLPYPTDPRVALCRILRRFAVRLLAAGHHHPWPWPLEADQLTLTLCAMAGRDCDQGDLDRARKLEAELGLPAEPAEHAPTYRDLLRARDRLTEQLAAAVARISRLETKLSYRERELVRAKAKLRRTQRKATAYRRTLGYRLTRRLARPRKVARRVIRLLSG
ncbi:hypothetical protein [Nonomuraea aridisoli]|uniref:Class I SAM-dependent methyltransferase n=1 Tax=Nonomuraea aridisoli TaxID=2070368 RepID=A0A2W2DVE5_9ACTN|nr:hypothetical protein [Nonomuraea aridisoli]PZG14473.1 hypothetical protein C1J01_26775 [Nonomuraea aridisoli]